MSTTLRISELIESLEARSDLAEFNRIVIPSLRRLASSHTWELIGDSASVLARIYRTKFNVAGLRTLPVAYPPTVLDDLERIGQEAVGVVTISGERLNIGIFVKVVTKEAVGGYSVPIR